MKINLSRVLLVAALLILAATSVCSQTVEFSATLQAYPLEFMHAGWGFGGETIGSSAWFSYSAFGEPSNDIIAVETPIVILQAVGNDITDSITITNVTLELVITQPFWLGSTPIECSGRIEL